MVQKKIAKKTTKKIVKKPSLKKAIKKTTPKKVIKKIVKEKKIGIVIHYFDKLKVAVLKLSNEIKAGDMVRIKGGKETDFKQKIASMEIDGKKIKKAKKGQKIGMKIKEVARVGYICYKLEK